MSSNATVYEAPGVTFNIDTGRKPKQKRAPRKPRQTVWNYPAIKFGQPRVTFGGIGKSAKDIVIEMMTNDTDNHFGSVLLYMQSCQIRQRQNRIELSTSGISLDDQCASFLCSLVANQLAIPVSKLDD